VKSSSGFSAKSDALFKEWSIGPKSESIPLNRFHANEANQAFMSNQTGGPPHCEAVLLFLPRGFRYCVNLTAQDATMGRVPTGSQGPFICQVPSSQIEAPMICGQLPKSPLPWKRTPEAGK